MNHLTDLVSPARTLAAAALLFLPSLAEGQVLNLSGATNNRGFYQQGSRRNIARHNTALFAAVVLQDGSVVLRRRPDDTSTAPWVTFVTAVNDSASGIGTTNPTTTASMAVSASGHLHITWGRYYYPSFFQQWYRCYDLTSGSFTHAPQDITAYVGATTLTRTDSMAIAVGPKDYVFMSAQNGTENWRSRLLQSAFVSFPTGAAPAWTNHGSIAQNAFSSQNVRMVIDMRGRVHMSFYNNTGNGQYATRVFEQPSTWYAQDQIGVPTSPRDDDGYLASDSLNYVHVLYKHLVSVSGGVTNWELLYRNRLDNAAWSAPMLVYAFSSTDVGSNEPKNSYALAAGRSVFAIYREYCSGRLMVKQRKFGASAFQFYSEMRPASSDLNDYYLPNVRSTLWPQGNGLFQYLDVSFRRPSGSSYELVHQRLHVTAMDIDFVGCPGTCGVPEITVGGVPCAPVLRTVEVGVEQARPGAPAFLLWTLSSTFASPFACGTLWANNYMPPPVIVNPCCNAKRTFVLGPGGCTTWVYFQYGILDSAAVGGFALSNRARLYL
ncbi:MAG: hypothetical protein KDC87_05015 [Planctomycetes bacterium]|nr:hypothetical protein [Planctomycetota bacterium]MCB9869752.1 hypothetical protein [Planctomycetota bacterium]